jgi:ribonuclease E
VFQPPLVIFQPPDLPTTGGSAADEADGGSGRRRSRSGRGAGNGGSGQGGAQTGSGQSGASQGAASQGAASQSGAKADGRADGAGAGPEGDDGQDGDGEQAGSSGRRRRRGGRGHSKSKAAGDEGTENGADGEAEEAAGAAGADGAGQHAAASQDDADAQDETTSGRRRRRRRRSGSAADTEQSSSDDPPNTVVHVRPPRPAVEESDVRSVKGSTRLEAKRQRRREGRESGRRRPPIITESEFLARREAVARVMVVRQTGDRTQIAVLEDGILVEHYVDKASSQSYVGNVYLGKVQNVLPSMEAAFVDIGKGRNAVLYAGEVNFDASGLEGESKRIESALKSGQSILVQATKDPIGHKGARLTSQISLPGRYLVYVPGASMTGISRKLPDTERTRLKQILKQVMPEHAGVIVRTAAEGASEEELSKDVARLAAQWEAIERRAKSATAPELLYSEPDLTIRVVRDIFNEDFSKLVISSDSEWDIVDEYIRYVAPHLTDRLERWKDDGDVFGAYRIDEQISKALERKVWLPSGGSLVIDTTEAMTVIDVNTGKFTGQGGNLEQTVTRNNLEAAEEIVRQLRVRDVGGIIVIDFIDMVLESNRDLVLRRLLECLARDRTKHQVAEVTSLGLVQMTRKRVGSGLLEAFSVVCEHCNGRGVLISSEPVDHVHVTGGRDERSGRDERGGKRSRGGKAKADQAEPDQAKADQAKADKGKPEAKSGKAKTGQAKDGQAHSDQAQADQNGAGQAGDGKTDSKTRGRSRSRSSKAKAQDGAETAGTGRASQEQDGAAAAAGGQPEASQADTGPASAAAESAAAGPDGTGTAGTVLTGTGPDGAGSDGAGLAGSGVTGIGQRSVSGGRRRRGAARREQGAPAPEHTGGEPGADSGAPGAGSGAAGDSPASDGAAASGAAASGAAAVGGAAAGGGAADGGAATSKPATSKPATTGAAASDAAASDAAASDAAASDAAASGTGASGTGASGAEASGAATSGAAASGAGTSGAAGTGREPGQEEEVAQRAAV